MTQLLLSEITEYVENHIGDFHAAKLRNLESLKLDNILKRKNPYLFRAKGIGIASDLVKLLMDAFLSSQEETLFGDFLEIVFLHMFCHNDRMLMGCIICIYFFVYYAHKFLVLRKVCIQK